MRGDFLLSERLPCSVLPGRIIKTSLSIGPLQYPCHTSLGLPDREPHSHLRFMLDTVMQLPSQDYMWPMTQPSRWHFLPIDSLKPVAFFLSYFNLISALSSYSHGHFNELCPPMWFQWVWILLPAEKSEPRRSLWVWSLWDWVCSPVKQECQHLPCRSTISYSNAPPRLWTDLN